MFYKYVYIFILLVIFFYIKWKLEKKQSNSQIKEDFFDGITWSNILNNTDFYRNITHLSSNINYNNNYFSIKTSNIGINFIDSNNDNFKIILNPKINNISFQNEYTIGQYSTPKLLEINFNNDLVECKNTRTTYVEDTQFNSDYEYYSIFKLDTSHVSLKPIQQSFTQINNSHPQYIKLEKKRMMESPSWKATNDWNPIIIPQGNMFNTPSNQHRVFSRGTSGSSDAGSEAVVKEKTEDMNDCVIRGATLCIRDSNCDRFQYYRDQANKYSYCKIFQFVDGVNPENDVEVTDGANDTFWIKEGINLY